MVQCARRNLVSVLCYAHENHSVGIFEERLSGPYLITSAHYDMSSSFQKPSGPHILVMSHYLICLSWHLDTCVDIQYVLNNTIFSFFQPRWLFGFRVLRFYYMIQFLSFQELVSFLKKLKILIVIPGEHIVIVAGLYTFGGRHINFQERWDNTTMKMAFNFWAFLTSLKCIVATIKFTFAVGVRIRDRPPSKDKTIYKHRDVGRVKIYNYFLQ